MSDTKKYPIDFDLVQKGDSFSMADLGEMFGKPAGSRELRLVALGLKQDIEDKCGVTCKVNDHGLFVLTDTEASAHNQQLFKQAQRQMRRSHRRNGQVDLLALTPIDRGKHLQGLAYQGYVLQAMHRSVREYKVQRLAPSTPKELEETS